MIEKITIKPANKKNNNPIKSLTFYKFKLDFSKEGIEKRDKDIKKTIELFHPEKHDDYFDSSILLKI